MSTIQNSLYRRQVLVIDSRNRDNYSPDVANWAGPGTAYLVNQKVLMNSVGYTCVVAHTSAALFATDLGAGNWQIATNISGPSSYKIRFPALKNVKMLRLVSTEIANTEYVINHKTRWIDWLDSVTGLTYSTPLSLGTYSATLLADQINTQMNASLGLGFGVGITVTYNIVTQKMVITRLAPGTTIALLWKTGVHGSDNLKSSAALVLGWASGSDTGVLATQTSPNLVNLVGDSYANMIIRGYPSLTTAGGSNDIFARIVWQNLPRNWNFNTFVNNAIIYPTPVNTIDNFEVQFLSYDLQLYDFNCYEHSYSIEFFCE